jgi:hypothetical protein
MIPIVKNPGAASKAPAARRSNRKRETTEREAVRHNRGSNRLVLAARSFAARITNCELTDQAAADLAAQWRLEIDAQECRVVEWFAPAKQAAFRAHAAICRQENEAVTPYRDARRALNSKLAVWQAAQRRLRAANETQADTGSRSGGEHEIVTGAASASGNAPRVEGVSFRENWRAEVVDKAAFVAAVASRPELVNLLDANLAALGHLARAHKSALNLPGVRVWCEQIVAASRRA